MNKTLRFIEFEILNIFFEAIRFRILHQIQVVNDGLNLVIFQDVIY